MLVSGSGSLRTFHSRRCIRVRQTTNEVDVTSFIGRRLHVVGTTCSGKSTLAARLAEVLQDPVVELDALNWQPGWVSLAATDPAVFEVRVAAATRG